MIKGKYDPKEHAKALYNMELHETIEFSKELYATRVPGGWIYDRMATDENESIRFMSSVFVPYNDEFKEIKRFVELVKKNLKPEKNREDLRDIQVCEKIDDCEASVIKDEN